MELDCHQLGQLTGSEEAVMKAWTTFEYSTMARMVIRHCPALTVSTTINELHYITAFKVYNSTVVSWTEDAAFNQADHLAMQNVYFVRTNFTGGGLPPGMISSRFPQNIRNIVTSVTNIATLPGNLHEVWPSRISLFFEMSRISTIPDTIIKLKVSMLSLAGSPLTDVPVELFEIPNLMCVLLSYTNIQELPAKVAHPSPAQFLLFVHGTNVSTFWSWMNPMVQLSSMFLGDLFNAYNTPYCKQLLAIGAGNQSSFVLDPSAPHSQADLADVMDVSTPTKLQYAQRMVSCTPGLPYYFALGLEDARSTHPS
jgi:hypothetical protein